MSSYHFFFTCVQVGQYHWAWSPLRERHGDGREVGKNLGPMKLFLFAILLISLSVKSFVIPPGHVQRISLKAVKSKKKKASKASTAAVEGIEAPTAAVEVIEKVLKEGNGFDAGIVACRIVTSSKKAASSAH